MTAASVKLKAKRTKRTRKDDRTICCHLLEEFGVSRLRLLARINLLEQLAHGRIQLAVLFGETLADRTRDSEINLARIQFHHHSRAVLNLLPRQAEVRSVNQGCAPGVNDPPGGRFAH